MSYLKFSMYQTNKEEKAMKGNALETNDLIKYAVRLFRKNVKYFKTYGLSYIINDFHRSDGEIVERIVQTNLDVYTDKIGKGRQETGNVEDL